MKNFKIAIFLIFSLLFLLVIGLVFIPPITDRNVQGNEDIFVSGLGHIYEGQKLSDDFELDLVALPPRYCWLNTRQFLDYRAVATIQRLVNSALEEEMCLVVTSSYRSYELQRELYSYGGNSYHEKVAKPGSSEHQTGLAVDLAACPMNDRGERDDNIERLELEKPFEELPEYKWMQENAHRYGFEQSYREDNQEESGYPQEPWHWKLVLE